MSLFSKNLQKFLIFFFTATSIVLVIMGVARTKKPTPVAEAPAPAPPTPSDTTGAITVSGNEYQTPWGNASASITVKGGKIVAVAMPSVPNSPPSVYAEPYLINQALTAGDANIQGVSGATYTSLAFKSSLESAIAKANTQGQAIAPSVGAPASVPTAKPAVPRRYRDDDDD